MTYFIFAVVYYHVQFQKKKKKKKTDVKIYVNKCMNTISQVKNVKFTTSRPETKMTKNF